MPHAVVEVDLGALRYNARVLAARTDAALMAVVKADGYGHGMVPAARAALAGGATWLGVATLTEALTLRRAGVDAPVLAWLWTRSETAELAAAVAAGVDVGVGTRTQLALVPPGARVHLEADTGLSRGGAGGADWDALVAAAAARPDVEVVAVWSHLARADEPGHPATAAALAAFDAATAAARAAGLDPPLRHLANSAALLTAPATHFDLVRAGIALYGLPPVPGLDVDLRPAMTLRAEVAAVRRVPAGTGVSYGHTYLTPRATTLALVPVGYGDGVPRAGSSGGPVRVAGVLHTVSGRVCMDQFVVDVGDHAVAEGDEVVVFGAPGPSATDWARATGTIDYEIVTRTGPRVPRVHLDPGDPPPGGRP